MPVINLVSPIYVLADEVFEPSSALCAYHHASPAYRDAMEQAFRDNEPYPRTLSWVHTANSVMACNACASAYGSLRP